MSNNVYFIVQAKALTEAGWVSPALSGGEGAAAQASEGGAEEVEVNLR